MTTSSIRELSEQENVHLQIPTEKIIEKKRIKGTPFEITSVKEQGAFINIGQIKLSEMFKTEEEALAHYNENVASIVMTACVTMSSMEIDMKLNQQTKQ